MTAPSPLPAPAVGGVGPDGRARRDLPAYLLLVLAGIALQVFSGNSDRLGFPIGPDRLCLGLGLVLLLLDPWAFRERPLRYRPLHLAMALLLVWAVLSALEAGTLLTAEGFYGLVDRLGALPFVMFVLAPVLFSTAARRSLLLAVLTGVGIYLGTVSVGEGLGVDPLVLPRYIADPSVGIHFGRARGPFLEAVANGLVMLACAVTACMGFVLWRSRWARALAVLCVALCTVGIVLTLTRAVWLGAVVAVAAVFTVVPSLRRWLLPAAGASAVVVVVLLLVVPGLREAAEQRLGDNRSADDRRNANAAAVRVLVREPLTGVGWSRFAGEQRDLVRQAEDYPITNTGIGVHNVPLSHAAELGLPAAALWTGVFGVAVVGALRRRAPTRELQVWRLGLLAYALAFVVVGSLGPLSYALPNLLLWTWAGILQPPAPAPARG